MSKKDDPHLRLGLITLFVFALLVLIGGIKNAMAYRNHNLDISGIGILVSCVGRNPLDEQGVRPIRESREESQIRKVSWYDYKPGDGINCDDPLCITASGEPYNPEDFTCACEPSFSFGTRFRVSYGDNSVVVRCNDRGSFWKAKYGYRMLDLSRKAFESLAPLSKGVITAKINVIKN